MKRVAILGSTGSVGRQALDVVAAHRERFQVVALAASRLTPLFERQLHEWQPALAALATPPSSTFEPGVGRIEVGSHAAEVVAAESDADLVLVAVPGRFGLCPT